MVDVVRKTSVRPICPAESTMSFPLMRPWSCWQQLVPSSTVRSNIWQIIVKHMEDFLSGSIVLPVLKGGITNASIHPLHLRAATPIPLIKCSYPIQPHIPHPEKYFSLSRRHQRRHKNMLCNRTAESSSLKVFRSFQPLKSLRYFFYDENNACFRFIIFFDDD